MLEKIKERIFCYERKYRKYIAPFLVLSIFFSIIFGQPTVFSFLLIFSILYYGYLLVCFLYKILCNISIFNGLHRKSKENKSTITSESVKKANEAKYYKYQLKMLTFFKIIAFGVFCWILNFAIEVESDINKLSKEVNKIQKITYENPVIQFLLTCHYSEYPEITHKIYANKNGETLIFSPIGNGEYIMSSSREETESRYYFKSLSLLYGDSVLFEPVFYLDRTTLEFTVGDKIGDKIMNIRHYKCEKSENLTGLYQLIS